MDPITQLDEILPLLKGLVARLDPSQLDTATPCADFAVRDVLGHMVGGAAMFGAAFRGEAPAGGGSDPDPLTAFPKAMDDLRDAVNGPGALGRTIQAPFGDVPGDTFARFVALDGLVHGWDISTATGQPYEPSPELVGAVDAFTRQALSPDMRAAGMFAEPADAPAGATLIEQLVAFTGRRVAR